MSLDKAVEHGKEYRKPYIREKAVDRTCRNHGSCFRSIENRLHASNIKREMADEKLKEYKKGMIGE